MTKKSVSILLCSAILTLSVASGSEAKATSIAVGAGITVGVIIAEHTSNQRPSTKNKHEKGQVTNQRNQFGGEKGDARRQPNPNKRSR